MRTLIAPLEIAYSRKIVCFFFAVFGICGEAYIQVASDAAIPGVYHEMDYSSIVLRIE